VDSSNLLFHGLWMLSAMGAAVFATAAAPVAARLSGFALGVGGGVVLSAGRLSDPALVGSLTAIVAAMQLLGSRTPLAGLVASTAAGALAGVWSAVLTAQGLVPRSAAIGAAVALLGAVVILAVRREGFAAEPLRDEALSIVMTLGLALAVAPAVMSGWRAAASLNVAADSNAAALPAWTLATVAVTCALGGLHSWWARR
jgi:hypothetical protein